MTASGGRSSNRIIAALLTVIIWALVTLFSMNWASDGAKKPLVETVSHGVSWNIIMAIAVLGVATLVFGWRDLQFVAPKLGGLFKVLWFPLLYLAGFAMLGLLQGLPPASILGFVALNTILVGLSEEWAFRGVLFQALNKRLALWPAIIMTCALFGGVHVANVFVTGKLGEGMIQALAAAMSGLVFMALLLRTGSIWVPILYHAAWDLGAFTVSAGSAAGASSTALTPTAQILFPLLLVLPNFLYALFLLRGQRRGAPSPA